nr:PREDICTED: uncharacterized protein LOC105667308 [Linepithema humile]
MRFLCRGKASSPTIICGIADNVPGVDCKNRWKTLRDCYRKHLKHLMTKSGQTAKKCLQYEREGSNVQSPTTSISDAEQDINDTSEASSIELTVRREASSGSSTSSGLKQRKKTPAQLSAAAFEECQRSKDKSSDHLAKYFMSVEETVRTFPPHLQIKVKTQISNILHNADDEEYEDSSDTGYELEILYLVLMNVFENIRSGVTINRARIKSHQCISWKKTNLC